MNNKFLIVFCFISALFLGLFFYGLKSFLDIKEKELINSNSLTCGQLYRYTETLSNKVVVSYPMVKEYQDCIQSK